MFGVGGLGFGVWGLGFKVLGLNLNPQPSTLNSQPRFRVWFGVLGVGNRADDAEEAQNIHCLPIFDGQIDSQIN